MNAENADCAARPLPRLRQSFRLQWEPAQDTYVLLHPEGMVKLNPSAGEILARCDGAHDLDAIISELEELFKASDLAADVYRFIDHARQRGWLD